MIELPPYLIYILTVISSLVISMVLIPQIILISNRKRLLDFPDNDRKLHSRKVPNLGGVAIFFAFIISCSLFINFDEFKHWNYIILSALTLFLTGITDDLLSLSPSKKLLAQIVATIITIYIADIRIVSLHGIFGIQELTYWPSVFISLFAMLLIINAFNLIDGIDGLAGSISVLCTLAAGICLAATGNTNAACIALGLMGAIIGFLLYNFAPARIFMGDTGSLLIGYVIAVLCTLFVNSYDSGMAIGRVIHSQAGAIVIVLAILSIPVFDLLRVFTARLINGKSPFKGDRTHIHYLLLDLGISHTRAAVILIVLNIGIIATAIALQDINPIIGVSGIAVISFGFFGIVHYMRKKRLAKD